MNGTASLYFFRTRSACTLSSRAPARRFSASFSSSMSSEAVFRASSRLSAFWDVSEGRPTSSAKCASSHWRRRVRFTGSPSLGWDSLLFKISRTREKASSARPAPFSRVIRFHSARQRWSASPRVSGANLSRTALAPSRSPPLRRASTCWKASTPISCPSGTSSIEVS